MKVFFWDFDEEYNQFNSISLPQRERRDFIDYFLGGEIKKLIESFPENLHGVVTNGDLDYQFRLLEGNELDYLFSKEISSSPFPQARKLMQSFPPLFLTHYNKIPLSLDVETNYWNLVFSLSKPNEAMYKDISTNLPIDPEDCYVVGTSYKDFLAAKKAGMKTIHIRGWEEDGKMNVRNLKEKPDFVINRVNMFNGLEKIFKSFK